MKHLILISALLFSFNGWADGLTLLCKGNGADGSSFAVFPDGGGLGVVTEGPESNNAEIFIKFSSNFDSGTIKIPKFMNDKPIGKKRTKFDLNEIKITENEISGKFKLRALDSPSFTINRVTGNMEYNGGWDSYVTFSGYCEEAKLDEKKF